MAQSVSAQQASTGDDEAMHANAAGLQGQLAAAISVLDLASGGGHTDATGELVITAEHVQVRLLAFWGTILVDRPFYDVQLYSTAWTIQWFIIRC